MKKRQKRLMTSVSALFVMLFALAVTSGEAVVTSDETVVPSAQEYCLDAGGCADTCDDDACEAIGDCKTWCDDICDGGGVWMGCEPDY